MYQIGRSTAPRARLKLTAFCTLSRRFSSLDRGGDRAAPARPSSGVTSTGASTALGVGLRQRPGGEPDASATPSAAAISPARWPSSKAHTESAVLHVHGAVAGDARRPGVAGDRGADRSGPALDAAPPCPACGPKRDSSARISLSRADPCSTSTSCAGLDRQRGRVRRRDHRLPHAPRRARPGRGGGRGRAPRARRRAGAAAARQQLRLGEQEREHGEPLLALRAELAQVAVAARDQDVVEVRPEARSRRARGRARAAPRAPRPSAARRRTRAAPPAARARRRARRTPARARPAPRGAPRRARRRASATRSVHGVERVARREAELDAPERGVSLRERREVVLRHAGARRAEPAEHAVEVRAAGGRPALDDGQPVGREDERRDLASQRLGRRQPSRRSAAPPSPGPAAASREISTASRRACRRRRRAPRRLAEADQLRVLARARREALRRDVQRLEQVRLADAVRPDDEHDAGRERELERRVRAVVAKRDVLDDQARAQPASLIGMIRYT